MKIYLLLILVVITSFLSQIMFKELAIIFLTENELFPNNFIYLSISLIKNKLFWVTIFMYGFSAFLWILSIKNIALSKAFSFLSLNYLLITAYSFYILKEGFTLSKLFSSIFIIGGILLIAQSEKLGIRFHKKNNDSNTV